MNGSEQQLVLLKNDYERIRQHLIGLEEAGQLTSYSKVLIVDMIYKVMENLAVRYPIVQKGVRAVMGGKVLDHEAKRIKQSGVEEGWKEGRIEGRKEGRIEGRAEGRRRSYIITEKGRQMLDREYRRIRSQAADYEHLLGKEEPL